MKNLLLLISALFITISSYSQSKGKVRHHKKHLHASEMSKAKDVQPTDMHNTGSSDGTMPDSKSNGSVTTNPKGKNGPKNTSSKKP